MMRTLARRVKRDAEGGEPYVVPEDRVCTDCTHLKRQVLAYLSDKPVEWVCPYRMHMGKGTGREAFDCEHYRMKAKRRKSYARELEQRAMAAKSERELQLEAEVRGLRQELSDALVELAKVKKDMRKVHEGYVMARAELRHARSIIGASGTGSAGVVRC